MAVPVAARWVAAACGVLLILTGWQSVIGTVIVPRPVASWLTRWVDLVVLGVYNAVTRPLTDWVRRDRILATQASAILVMQLVMWLGIFLTGFHRLAGQLRARGLRDRRRDRRGSRTLVGSPSPLLGRVAAPPPAERPLAPVT